MPLYEYLCRPNHHRFEVRQGINEPPVSECPECGGEVRRVIHPVGVVFKGSGFYVNDSRSSSSKSKTPSGQKTESKSESGGESKSDSKPDSKSESAAAS